MRRTEHDPLTFNFDMGDPNWLEIKDRPDRRCRVYSKVIVVKFKIWKKSRIVETGVMVGTSGVEMPFVTDIAKPYAHVLPVDWKSGKALMRFCSWREDFGVNTVANQLVAPANLSICGPVWITTKMMMRFKMRVWATRATIMEAIEHLDLSAQPIIAEVGDVSCVTTSTSLPNRTCSGSRWGSEGLP
jgi:hypothetical protein